MSGKKKAVVKAEPVDLYRLQLPKGHHATFYRTHELTAGRAREFQVMLAHMTPILRRAERARVITVDGEKDDASDDAFEGADLELSRDDTRKMFELNDLALVTYLKSWSLRTPDGQPQPLPETVDELINSLPIPIYTELQAHASKLVFEADDDMGFTVNSVEDEESPTGGSAL